MSSATDLLLRLDAFSISTELDAGLATLTKHITEHGRVPSTDASSLHDTFWAAIDLSRLVSRIYDYVHAMGIVWLLSDDGGGLLHPGERVLGLSLGSDNASADYDVMTTARVAEVSFTRLDKRVTIIRRGKVLTDLVKVASAPIDHRFLYCFGPQKLFKNKARLGSMRSRYPIVNSYFASAADDEHLSALAKRVAHPCTQSGCCRVDSVHVVDLAEWPSLKTAFDPPALAALDDVAAPT